MNEDLVNVFEKEFDVGDMTEKTIESLFRSILNLKPDKPPALPAGPLGGAASVKTSGALRGSGASPEKGMTLRAQPVRGSGDI